MSSKTETTFGRVSRTDEKLILRLRVVGQDNEIHREEWSTIKEEMDEQVTKNRQRERFEVLFQRYEDPHWSRVSYKSL